MDEQLQHVIHLIQMSELDQTIIEILIRDLEKDGLNEFLCEQIKAYCLEEIKNTDEKIEQARKVLEDYKSNNSAA